MCSININYDNVDKIQQYFDSVLGNVSSKRLFTGYGLFYKKMMFAMIQNNRFYLKAEDALAEHLESLGAKPFDVFQTGKGNEFYHYYPLSESILRDQDELKKLVMHSITTIIRKNAEVELAKKNRIKELTNLTIKQERLLKKVGIDNVEQFRSIGAEQVIVLLKKSGIPVRLEFYWKLVAALKNKNVYLLTPQEKQVYFDKLNQALKEAGLRGYTDIDKD